MRLSLFLFALALLCGGAARAKPLPFTGVNLAGGEFGEAKRGVRQVYGKNFIYPSAQEVDYYIGKGVNIIRLPFRWEVVQPQENAPLDPAEMARLKAVVTMATGKGLTVILDPHNYARYYGTVVGTLEVPAAVLADFWGRLAAQFADNPRVWLGLMNEPHDMPTRQWLGDANAALAAIRRAGAKNLVLVPGNSWTGAHSWMEGGPEANAVVMLQIHDPARHYIFDVHQYLDADSSGTHPEVVGPKAGSERLKEFTQWCHRHHQRGFLGEFGTAASPEAHAAVDDMLVYMEQNRDVWVGFTWWSGGLWWGDYMFTVEPKDGQDRPQMSYLMPHLQHEAKPMHE